MNDMSIHTLYLAASTAPCRQVDILKLGLVWHRVAPRNRPVRVLYGVYEVLLQYTMVKVKKKENKKPQAAAIHSTKIPRYQLLIPKIQAVKNS